MNNHLPKSAILSYFRMGLVTGLIDIPEVISWADQQIMSSQIPEEDIIELSLSGKKPYSQLIWLLNHLQGNADHSLAVNMLFAKAGLLLVADPSRAPEIIQGIRLVCAEAHLPKEVKAKIFAVESDFYLYNQEQLSLDELAQNLTGFLEEYIQYQSLLTDLDQPQQSG